VPDFGAIDAGSADGNGPPQLTALHGAADHEFTVSRGQTPTSETARDPPKAGPRCGEFSRLSQRAGHHNERVLRVE
jgi:hypothetical protein